MNSSTISAQRPGTGWRLREWLRLLAALAVVGQLILLSTAWLLPALSEYHLVSDTISEVVLGRYGATQTVAFVIAGVGALGLAIAVRELTTRSWGSLIGTLLLAAWGLGTFGAAIFETDPIGAPADLLSTSTRWTIHAIVALVSFLSIICGMWVFTWVFRRNPKWRSLSVWSAVFAAGTLSLVLAQAQGPLVGLMQRLLISWIAIWLVLVAFRVRAIAGSADTMAAR